MFEHDRMIAQLRLAAKRLGLILKFARQGEKLYVKIAGETDPTPPKSRA